MSGVGKSRSAPGDGDWICSDAKCNNVNFSRRTKCNKCGLEKTSSSTEFRKAGHEIGAVMADKSKGLFSADDWQCKMCGNVNWARRNTCNMCSAPKYGKTEHRTGYGGGYMEREKVVSYKEREDSDGEFDEFGRKKKKCRVSSAPEPKHEDDEDKAEGDDDDDDDEDGDLSKYQLESDDDEDGGDLSKYQLSDDDDDKKSASSSSSSSSSSRSSSSGSRTKSKKRAHGVSRSRSRSPHSKSSSRRTRDSRSRSRSGSRDHHSGRSQLSNHH